MRKEAPVALNEIQEARFEQIGQDAVVRAESVPCDLEDFTQGLKIILETFKERYVLACEETGSEPEPF
jgi:hypothetical protein